MSTLARTFGILTLLSCTASAAFAEEHVVEGVVTQWRPLVTFAKPGDTLRFKSMTGHDTQTIEGMIPEGAQGWQSKLGEEGYNVNLTQEGAYVFKCAPHISSGMVGVVIVGEARPPANLAAIEANLDSVKVGKNMVNRALKKAKQALEEEAK